MKDTVGSSTRRLAHLVVGEDSEGVELDLWRKAGAGCIRAPNDARDKSSMAQPILQRRLMRPIRAFPAPVTAISPSSPLQMTRAWHDEDF